MAKRAKGWCSVKESRRWFRTGYKADKYEEYKKFKKDKGIEEIRLKSLKESEE